MLLGARIVLTVPLRYKFKPISPRDADTANTLCLEVCSVPAVCELPVSLCERKFVPSDCDIKINTIHEGWCSFLWRRKRDSNPRAFWANGFQDRLVMTTSICLRIIFYVIRSTLDDYNTLLPFCQVFIFVSITFNSCKVSFFYCKIIHYSLEYI